ncbi:MAG: heme ABC transporter ATP-binding protein [Dehalococcoidia bacterium]
MIELSLSHISFSYIDVPVLHDIDLVIERGEMVALLGPNGSGKTTLIKLLSGVLRPAEGEIHLDGSSLRRLKRREVAQRVAVVPQQFHMPFAFTLREVVLLGRTPFLKAFSNEDEGDYKAVQRSMELIGIGELGQRFFNELSGGERQKGILAMALAQEPKLLLLDEPTAHLDINHQVEILDLVKGLNQEQGITVIGAMHDLNLAALYFDRLILLKEGRIFADGPPSDVLTEGTIKEVFSASVQVMQHPSMKAPHIVITPKRT